MSEAAPRLVMRVLGEDVEVNLFAVNDLRRAAAALNTSGDIRLLVALESAWRRAVGNETFVRWLERGITLVQLLQLTSWVARGRPPA